MSIALDKLKKDVMLMLRFASISLTRTTLSVISIKSRVNSLSNLLASSKVEKKIRLFKQLKGEQK